MWQLEGPFEGGLAGWDDAQALGGPDRQCPLLAPFGGTSATLDPSIIPKPHAMQDRPFTYSGTCKLAGASQVAELEHRHWHWQARGRARALAARAASRMIPAHWQLEVTAKRPGPSAVTNGASSSTSLAVARELSCQWRLQIDIVCNVTGMNST